MTESIWTPERMTQLRELWRDGLSSLAIGRLIGVTKNAVVGKAARMHLPRRPSPIRARKPSAIAKKPNPAPKPRLVGTTDRPCSWPIGEPGEPGFHFCDEPAVEGRPYCADHQMRAHVRAPLKRVTAP